MNESEITNKLLVEMIKNQKESSKNFVKVFIVVIIGFTFLLLAMIIGFFYYESQFEIDEKTTTQMETAIDQEASGEEAEINNVLGNMYKDNSTHNEGE